MTYIRSNRILSATLPTLAVMVLGATLYAPAQEDRPDDSARRKTAEPVPAQAPNPEPSPTKPVNELSDVGSVQAEWFPSVPLTVFDGETDAVEPWALCTNQGALLVAAESRAKGRVLLARSEDGGGSWQTAVELTRIAPNRANRVSVGAGGTLASGRLVLALHEWNEQPGNVTWIEEKPVGTHHYSWSGFRRHSTLRVLKSDDQGRTWNPATCSLEGGPIAPAGMGRVFESGNVAWMPVFGPADEQEMDAALSGAGLMRSDDGGASWRFSHWMARANVKQQIAYGPGEITVLPNGTWLGMLQANHRRLGDYARPRISRTASSDGGQTWSAPTATLLGPRPTLAQLDRGQLMVGTRQDRGIIFSILLNAGTDLLYQDQLWETIWYEGGERGGLNLLKLDDDSLLATHHWMDPTHPSRCEIRSQVVKRRPEFRMPLPEPSPQAPREEEWVMAEAFQVPDIAAAPGGTKAQTLLKLKSGDWIAIGMATVIEGTGAHGFSNKDFVAVRAPALKGPWKKVGELTPLADVVGDATGSNMPRPMMQTRSGRLLLPVTHGAWNSPDRDMHLLYSDDDGATWGSLGLLGQQIGMRLLSSAQRIEQLADGRLLWILQVGREDWQPAKGNLLCVTSSDDGGSWQPLTWFGRAHDKHYAGLPSGRDSYIRTPEGQLLKTTKGHWLGMYREERGSPVPGGRPGEPVGMPNLMLTRSEDGRHWTPAFGFLGVEPDMAVLPGGAILAAYREDNLATAWLSYDHGRTWQWQTDFCEVPWRRAAIEAHGQWPPGGEAAVRVLDDTTAVTICESGLLPTGKPLPKGFEGTKELHGRLQVRFFRRVKVADRQDDRGADKTDADAQGTDADAAKPTNLVLRRGYEYWPLPNYGGPDECKDEDDKIQLTDGQTFYQRGRIWGDKSTVGWSAGVNTPVVMLFDLGAEATLSELRFNTTGGGSAGVVDVGLRVYVSLDNQTYVIAGERAPPERPDTGECRGAQMVVPLAGARARYVAVAAMAPAPFYFVFVDEIELLGVTPADPKSTLPVQPGVPASGAKGLQQVLAGGRRSLDRLTQITAPIARHIAAWPAEFARNQNEELQQVLAKAITQHKEYDRLLAELTAGHRVRARQVYGDDVLAWEVPPDDAFTPLSLPEQVKPRQSATIHTVINGYEATALGVANLTEEMLPLQVGVSGGAAGAPKMSVRVARFAQTYTRIVPDILLAGDSPQTVPPGESRMVWLETESAGVKPGTYPFEIEVGLGGQRRRVPLTVRVHNVTLSRETPLATGNWSDLNTGDSPPYQNLTRVRDEMLANRITVGALTAYPLPKKDAEGRVLRPLQLDFTDLDKALAFHRDFPQVSFFFSFDSHSSRPHRDWFGPAEWMSDEFQEIYREWLGAIIQRIKQSGRGYDQFCFMNFDETMDAKVGQLCRLAHSVDPKVRIMITVPQASREATQGLVSAGMNVFCYHAPRLELGNGPEGMDILTAEGRELWLYNAADAAHGVGKEPDPLGYYRYLHWTAFRHGATGAHFWNMLWNNGRSPVWSDEPIGTAYYPMVYCQGPGYPAPPADVQTDETVIPSRRWRHVRMGIEDYMLLRMARERIAALGDAGAKHQVQLDEIVITVLKNRSVDRSLFRDQRRELVELVERLVSTPQPATPSNTSPTKPTKPTKE